MGVISKNGRLLNCVAIFMQVFLFDINPTRQNTQGLLLGQLVRIIFQRRLSVLLVATYSRFPKEVSLLHCYCTLPFQQMALLPLLEHIEALRYATN